MKYFEIITTYGWGIYAALSPPPKIVEGPSPLSPPKSPPLVVCKHFYIKHLL